MKIVKLEDMTKVSKRDLDEVICPNEGCPEDKKGIYINCYMHTHICCEEFDRWYSRKYRLEQFKETGISEE